VLLLNEDEAFSLTHEGPAQAVRELADTYRLVCVKCGTAGAIASFEGALLHAEPPSIAPGEATGAGDAFAGTLLAALVLGNPAEAALKAACRAGAAAAEAIDPWPQG
jgi:sugar/nucleoside kinase (ribokinase family)